MRTRSLLAAAATAVTAALSLAAPAGPAATPSCAPTDPTGRPVRLGNADNGRTLCLLRRQRLHVTLTVDATRYPNPANWWKPITTSGTALTPVPLPALPPPGVTAASFVVTGAGPATVTSYWDICPQTGPPCGAPVLLWQATVEVAHGR
ncbi:hypothetical protein O7626_07395 [Micromonospora sp. WMMD1102]|uniref:hypothetical protein n=1 Tax=Micromonospora sp. WMMD1102 TaxID=3016105 RepID=UPI0024153A39|nr:hypothetical protein [Micromonospora sp. WMMD1102]MDG4785756.1 hypothetical protein [Micromonospora sp. WMMD1102]